MNEGDTMHVYAVRAAIGCSQLPMTQRAILWAMCCHVGAIHYRSGLYTGSMRALAAQVGCDLKTIRTHLPKLVAAGWLVRGESAPRSAVPYTLQVPEHVKVPEPPDALEEIEDDVPHLNARVVDLFPQAMGRPPIACGTSSHTLKDKKEERESVCGEDVVEPLQGTTPAHTERVTELNEKQHKTPTEERAERLRDLQVCIWSALVDSGLTGELQRAYSAATVPELKRAIAREVRFTALAIDARGWRGEETRAYLIARLDSYTRRDLDPRRWLELARSTQDLSEWSGVETRPEESNAAQPVARPQPQQDELPDAPWLKQRSEEDRARALRALGVLNMQQQETA